MIFFHTYFLSLSPPPFFSSSLSLHTHTQKTFSRGISLYAANWPAPSCQDAQLTLLAFDILSVEGECVAHLPLSERKRLLRRAVVAESEYGGANDDEEARYDHSSQKSVSRFLQSDSHVIPRSAADPGRNGGLRIGRGASKPEKGIAGNAMRGRLLAMVPGEPPLRSLGELAPRCEFGSTRRDVEVAAMRAEKNFGAFFS